MIFKILSIQSTPITRIVLTGSFSSNTIQLNASLAKLVSNKRKESDSDNPDLCYTLTDQTGEAYFAKTASTPRQKT